jgi:hypothetical protein
VGWVGCEGRAEGVRGFPPFRQKEGERMGHGAFVGWVGWEGRAEGVRGLRPFRQKEGERMVHGAFAVEIASKEKQDFDWPTGHRF